MFPFRWAVAHGEDEYGLWQAFELGGVRQRLRWMPPPHGGKFWMGSPKDEPGRFDGEDLHEAAVGGFWMADTAVTQALWIAVMKDNPSSFKDNPRQPVERVSWNDIVDTFFPQANAMLSGLELRLPCEAEWEYAARAAGQARGAYWWGDKITPEHARYGRKIENGSTVRVDQFQRNAQGLWVLGNVWEWTADAWIEHLDAVQSPDHHKGDIERDGGPGASAAGRAADRVLRGGCWGDEPRSCRLAYRGAGHPGYRDSYFGFRLARGPS